MSSLRRLLDDGKNLFGTDGARGVAGSELSVELALAIGQAAGAYLRQGPVLVGRDTRRSGPMLSAALQAGFNSVGVDTVDVGVLPSGGISHLTATSGATLGAIVSASHNPAADNGIKLLSSQGSKLPDEVEREIEDRIRSSGTVAAVGPGIGTRFEDRGAMDVYLDHLVAASKYSLAGLRVVVDCAHGSAYKAAPELFKRLKADVEAFADAPDGTNINVECGATHPETVAAMVNGRIGLSFDGDADRLIVIDEDGKVANGDVVMAIVARHLKSQGQLKHDLLVATVMSNLGLHKSMKEAEIEMVLTQVGDRYVMEALTERRGLLGGEQSGHIIFTDTGTTGDGLMTAVRLLNVVAGTGKELRELRSEAITEYPQVLVNVGIDRAADVDGADHLWEEVGLVEEELGAEGRVLVRPSGTEPLIRIMVEASSETAARGYADRLAAVAADVLGKE
ncbi:MAG: phosphoglucosamine mutase [Acidimicrobiia bacterium]|nr:phosphoglucosamine mutase [Acidimicrobiia bacterium]